VTAWYAGQEGTLLQFPPDDEHCDARNM
jgi:hypothetical protein